MKPLIQSALGDGQGNISMMRVVMVIVILAVIASKFYNSYLTKTPIVWDKGDFELVGTVVAGKLVQNTQEKTP